jgi:hypothetical protein
MTRDFRPAARAHLLPLPVRPVESLSIPVRLVQ